MDRAGAIPCAARSSSRAATPPARMYAAPQLANGKRMNIGPSRSASCSSISPTRAWTSSSSPHARRPHGRPGTASPSRRSRCGCARRQLRDPAAQRLAGSWRAVVDEHVGPASSSSRRRDGGIVEGELAPDCLLRFQQAKPAGLLRRARSPPAGSTFSTSAPSSASQRVATGPASPSERSRTPIPWNGPSLCAASTNPPGRVQPTDSDLTQAVIGRTRTTIVYYLIDIHVEM